MLVDDVAAEESLTVAPDVSRREGLNCEPSGDPFLNGSKPPRTRRP